jgi:mRNA interferase RelE/StbE
MKYQVNIESKAKKALNKIPNIYKEKMIKALRSLAVDPFQGKKLEGELKGQYSIRVWPYRIIYQIYKKELIISIIDVGHRQGVYKI